MNQEANHNDTTTKVANYATKKGEVVLRPHVFDGIQEYDQRLPNWWLFTLYAAIVLFVGFYLYVYTFGAMKLDSEAFDEKVEAINKERAAALQKTVDSLDNETLVNKWATDSSIVAAGEKTYSTACVACHGADLSGGIGRPLNDGVWNYSAEPMGVFKMILEGTPKGSTGYKNIKMPPMGGAKLSSQQVAELTAFLISKNPKDFAKYKK